MVEKRLYEWNICDSVMNEDRFGEKHEQGK